MSNVRAFKLINGLEIIGKEELDEGGYIVLDDAVVAAIQQGQNGEPSLRFLPVSPLVKGQAASKITIQKTAIAMEFPLETDYESGYTTAVSGIVVASAIPSSIITR